MVGRVVRVNLYAALCLSYDTHFRAVIREVVRDSRGQQCYLVDSLERENDTSLVLYPHEVSITNIIHGEFSR